MVRRKQRSKRHARHQRPLTNDLALLRELVEQRRGQPNFRHREIESHYEKNEQEINKTLQHVEMTEVNADQTSFEVNERNETSTRQNRNCKHKIDSAAVRMYEDGNKINDSRTVTHQTTDGRDEALHQNKKTKREHKSSNEPVSIDENGQGMNRKTQVPASIVEPGNEIHVEKVNDHTADEHEGEIGQRPNKKRMRKKHKRTTDDEMHFTTEHGQEGKSTERTADGKQETGNTTNGGDESNTQASDGQGQRLDQMGKKKKKKKSKHKSDYEPNFRDENKQTGKRKEYTPASIPDIRNEMDAVEDVIIQTTVRHDQELDLTDEKNKKKKGAYTNDNEFELSGENGQERKRKYQTYASMNINAINDPEEVTNQPTDGHDQSIGQRKEKKKKKKRKHNSDNDFDSMIVQGQEEIAASINTIGCAMHDGKEVDKQTKDGHGEGSFQGKKKKKKKKKSKPSIDNQTHSRDENVNNGNLEEQTPAGVHETGNEVNNCQEVNDKSTVGSEQGLGQSNKKKKKRKHKSDTERDTISENRQNYTSRYEAGNDLNDFEESNIQMTYGSEPRDKNGNIQNKNYEKYDFINTGTGESETHERERFKGSLQGSPDSEIFNLDIDNDESAGHVWHETPHSRTEHDTVSEDECGHSISNSKFDFSLSIEEWKKMKPVSRIYRSGKQVRRLVTGAWTDVFAKYVNIIHKGCVLTFVGHNIKNMFSRKSKGSFMIAKADCTGIRCSASFEFKIHNEPVHECPVKVECEVRGDIQHSKEEVNRRNITGLSRKQLGEKIRKETVAQEYYETVLKTANHDEMLEGNFTSAPNPTVLRKIVSELTKKETLHANIINELVVMKECENSNAIDDVYIRDIGLDPFNVILYSGQQIDLLKQCSPNVYLYIDATGSVITNIPGQKRPYLYSIVVKPDHDLPAVSVADMISTQHSIPRIELFLSMVKRAVNLSGKRCQVGKIETDFSFALIQACLHTFNNLTLKTYIQKCYEVIVTRIMPEGIYVHHLCAAHLINDFSRHMKQIDLRINFRKNIRTFSMNAFAALQNAIELPDFENIFKDICIVLLHQTKTDEVDAAERRLVKKFRELPTDDTDSEDEFSLTKLNDMNEDSPEDKTIKEASPFSQHFQHIKESVICEIGDRNKDNDNEMYCPEVVECLLNKFIPTAPLWTGMMLAFLDTTEGIQTRDTNAPVESWFKFLKHDMGIKKHERPYKFTLRLKDAVHARLMERRFPGCRKKKTSGKRGRKSGKKETDPKLNIKEEVWNRKQNRTGKYHKTQKVRDLKTKQAGNVSSVDYPAVMRWGGRVQAVHMQNTCTIDNALTILHLKSKEYPEFLNYLRSEKAPVFQTLSTVITLMNEGQFSQAKVAWLTNTDVTIQPSTNLHGDDVDMYVKYFDRHWESGTESVCNGISCPRPRIESRLERGINISTSTAFRDIQELVDRWLITTSLCRMDFDSDRDDDDSCSRNSVICQGTRTITRVTTSKPCVLIIRVYEHSLFGRVSLNGILSKNNICIDNSRYVLAGVTMHRVDHYCALITSVTYGRLWYDGLDGELTPFLPLDKSNDEWFPQHAIYCKIG